ncbi:MAG TPA: energy-coupling factor transporter transmembrane component T [Clostridia bacterium]|nr:energy-coupling factor transporter transmembrane component T [Clostridia bacterium]
MKGFLDYVYGETVLHRTHPLIKLLLAVLLSLSCFLTNSLPVLLAILALETGIGAIGGVRERTLGTLGTLIKLCAFLFVLQVLFIRQGTPLLTLPLKIVITDLGLRFSATLCLRLIGATLPLMIMLSVTKMSDLTNAMCAQLRIPYRYTFVFITALRFIPVLTREMADVMEAQKARGVALDGGFFHKLRLIPPLCVPLLVSSVQRMEENALAADLRGFHLRTRASGYKRYPLRGIDFMAMGLGVLTAALAALL